MQVTAMKWLGIRTDNFEPTVAFYRDVMRLPIIHTDTDFTVFEAPDGSTVEVFGPRTPWNRHLEHPAAGFFVTDIDEAAADLAANDIEIVLPIQRADKRAWLHFRGPDGSVFGLTQVG